MKQIIAVILLVFFSFSAVGCTTDPELKELQNQTKELKQQLSVEPTPRPLSLRTELLDELQEECEAIESSIPELTPDTRDEFNDAMEAYVENLGKQSEIVGGINNEENYRDLTDKVSGLIEKGEKYTNEGAEKQAQEILKQINLITYGNEKGEKTW